MVRSPKKSGPSLEMEICIAPQRALAPYLGPAPAIPEQLLRPKKRQDALPLKGQNLLFCTARSHVSSGGISPFAARRCLSHYAPSHSFRDSLRGIFQDWIKGKFVCAREYE